MPVTELIFASNNPNKIAELTAISPASFRIISLTEAGIHTEIEEPYFTLEENAKEKCRVIWERIKKDCFSEDTGLEVETLQNEPGVFSARYAGVHGDTKANIEKLLTNLKGQENRKARFRTVISLLYAENYYLFEGICEGHIIREARGDGGFGYDPIFIPDGYTLTFSEMDKQLKNSISHRKKAFDKLFLFLNQIPSRIL